MNDVVFERCQEINRYLSAGDESQARGLLIQLLDYMEKKDLAYTPLVNALIRLVGLYPYMDIESSDWEDAFAYEAFKEDVGLKEKVVLHREQFRLLTLLLKGRSIAVSAPTSFGKSFIIDAFIKIQKPNNVVIIVPTIALTDETRRRIYKKFSDAYNIVTTTDGEVLDRNIFIFPQERALHFVNKIKSLDILIIDEFYKSSQYFDRERSSSLIRAIIKFGKLAKQRYYLSPNISKIEDNRFIQGMQFVKIDFCTVFLKIQDFYDKIGNDQEKKKECFLRLNNELRGKTLIYAGSYSGIEELARLVADRAPIVESSLLKNFADWLSKNYCKDWNLNVLVRRGFGIHNGSLHRSLSQIQIKLFEEVDGLNRLISTSSIIEGVNTSAANVIVWKTTGSGLSFNCFSYKNLIGRAGRMFRHFVGNVYVLAKAPKESDTELQIPFPEKILGGLDKKEDSDVLDKKQIEWIENYDREMQLLLGEDFEIFKQKGMFQSQDFDFIRDVAREIVENKEKWFCLRGLTFDNPSYWKRPLFKILELQKRGYSKYSKRDCVNFITVIANNWVKTIPELMRDLAQFQIDFELFFRLEGDVSFKMASLISDVNVLQRSVLRTDIDLAPFVSRLSSVFLPSVVYQLEEYGLPRMLSRKIQNSGLLDFERKGLTLKSIIDEIQSLDQNGVKKLAGFDSFDSYVYDYFLDGISRTF